MPRHNLRKAVTGIMLCLLLLVASIGVTFAWYGRDSVEIPAVSGSISYTAKYFQSGDGTEASPYEILTPEQFYNLAWLQYMGYFDGTATHFKLSDDLENTLDMSDYWLPPIGTTAHPFTGVFNGNGKVISGLKISSSMDDWTYIPSSITSADDVGEDIGVFGKISSSEGSVSKFYLQNLTVKTTVSGNVGLIAGNVDGNLSGVGVCGGRIMLENQDSPSIKSDYSLVGKINGDVVWEDLPGAQVNDTLLVAPSRFDSSVFTSLSNNQSVPVPDCVNLPTSDEHFGGTAAAKMISKLSQASFPGRTPAYYIFKDTELTFGDPSTPTEYTFNTTTGNYASMTYGTSSVSLENGNVIPIETEFWVDTARYGIIPGSAPDWNAPDYAYPKNVVWFKPVKTGKCGIAFAANNMSNNGHMSIYRYVRDENGNIDQNCIEEMILTFSKSILKNADIVYYYFDLGDLKDSQGREYEFAIGKSSKYNDTNVAFYFLKIAGTGSSAGEGTDENAKKILSVDYVKSAPLTSRYQVWDTGYKVHNIRISLDGTVTNDQTITYSVAPDTDTAGYLAEPSTGGVTITSIGDGAKPAETS